ncbi:hypothetical protein F8M41_021471 [Gigaspora margarita]|uniref:Uncharacterized protein n=1 Tax=Gigaspora margarita TaxID=4874 RepID=A0A8H4B1M8_GIGMA|nr:hypothetical protein F8M41_021471 [Gigaspora margarita]
MEDNKRQDWSFDEIPDEFNSENFQESINNLDDLILDISPVIESSVNLIQDSNSNDNTTTNSSSNNDTNINSNLNDTNTNSNSNDTNTIRSRIYNLVDPKFGF